VEAGRKYLQNLFDIQPNLKKTFLDIRSWDPEGATAPLDAQQLRWDSKTKINFYLQESRINIDIYICLYLFAGTARADTYAAESQENLS
jgi:hypothetical protein